MKEADLAHATICWSNPVCRFLVDEEIREAPRRGALSALLAEVSGHGVAADLAQPARDELPAIPPHSPFALLPALALRDSLTRHLQSGAPL